MENPLKSKSPKYVLAVCMHNCIYACVQRAYVKYIDHLHDYYVCTVLHVCMQVGVHKYQSMYANKHLNSALPTKIIKD